MYDGFPKVYEKKISEYVLNYYVLCAVIVNIKEAQTVGILYIYIYVCTDVVT